MTTRLPSPRRSVLAQLVLALALLIAQTAAQAHVYSHLAAGTAQSDFNGTVGQLCGECLAGTPLLSATGTPAAPCIAFVADAVAVVVTAITPFFEPAHHYAFRSRAPPELL
ncbi:MAG TPA: hypothetical protein VFS52_12155 [Steroidobacteraceae bacterium]|jgi:hypothetical protein|nr:hypothetical protein [Steroidobacteraceae bacterium]